MSESIGDFLFIRVHLGAEIVDQKLAYNAKIHVLHQKCARWLEVVKITKMILLRVWGTSCISKKRVNQHFFRDLFPAQRVDHKLD